MFASCCFYDNEDDDDDDDDDGDDDDKEGVNVSVSSSWGEKSPLPIGHIRILGIELDLAWSGGSCRGIHLHMKRFPHKSLHFMLDPVQYQEYEYGLMWQREN